MAIVPLKGTNYPTWKVQCQMALMKDGLWNIVNGSEHPPAETDSEEKKAKFAARKDRALATVVLSVDPSLLYLLGSPEDPKAVWDKLAGQFQKKTWANKLELRRKLYALQLREGESVHEHIKTMTEIFNSLSVIGSPVSDEDRVVHLLASLPESYSMLVTALEASAEVPQMEVVTERLIHEERKLKERESAGGSREEAMYTKSRKGPKCHHCGRYGHIKRNCDQRAQEKRWEPTHKDVSPRQKANKARLRRESSSSDSESVGLMVRQVLSASTNRTNSWIVDSGATCHMCNDHEMFSDFCPLRQPLEVALGDGHLLEAIGRGVVSMKTKLPDGKVKKCKLHDVLCVPALSYNLLSVSKVTEAGKVTNFTDAGCQIVDSCQKVVAVAVRVGSLYYLECLDSRQQVHTASVEETKETIWHRRFGHLSAQNLQKLRRDQMVSGFDFDASKDIGFCESCVEGKHHRSQFPASCSKPSGELLELVHSDVCGKVNAKSLSGAEYFLTFIDDKTRYVWTYVLKRKDQVFEKFLEWKALVEKSSGQKLKTLRSDNGGEFTSTRFENYLKSEGVRHELTVPKTPQQNGVAERMNRTLVETVRSMLADANLPQKFWAEALSTATYLRNRSPAKSVKGTTPAEAWMGEKPDVNHLRAFGCTAYAHVAKDERHKLDSKARKCIFLGYCTESKGYRLYDPVRARVFISCDVIFNESGHEVEKEPSEAQEESSKQDQYVHFDCPESSSEIDDTEPGEVAEPVQRRSGRERAPPDYFGHWVFQVDEKSNEPASFKDALASPDRAEWQNAMEKELESLQTNDVWDLVELPEGRKAVGSKWVFKLKVDADGSVVRHKARLVAQGFSQKFGLDYDETFCPVVRFESVRAAIALGVQNGLKLHQMDVTTAFLNGNLEEEVYMKQPEGFAIKGQEHLVCKLKRSIYGLKQSPRCWNSALDEKLKKMGFVQSASDPCLYVFSDGEMFIIAVYVDDILLGGKSDGQMSDVKKALSKQFKMKDMGALHHFLGVKIVRDPRSGDIWIGQQAYSEAVLQKFGMEHAKAVATPVDTSSRLVRATEKCDSVDQAQYQSAVGSLLYLSTRTRPDITYAVSNVARFCAKPTQQHWIAVKRILRYLKGTPNFGLLYSKKSLGDLCVGYSDADWAGDIDDRKSTSGYVFQIGGTAVSWRSKKQTCVALSTAEAEYMALASAAQEAVWMRQLTADLKCESTGPLVIFEDNQAAISMSKNPQFHGRAKHVDIKYHFIRENVKSGVVQLKYCPTEDMIADILTKGLPQDKFVKLRLLAGVTEHSACK